MASMTIFGATGGTGRALVEQGLAQGHTVIAFVRDLSKLGIEDPNLTQVQGDVFNQIEVANAVAGSDVVVITLGKTDNGPDNIVSAGTKHILKAMHDHGVSRVIIVSSVGVGESVQQLPFVARMFVRTVLRKAIADKAIQEQLVKDSGLEWTIVRPVGLTDGPKTGEYLASVDTVKGGQVARADVADFILQELQENEYVRQAVSLS